jgi:hypothetical protein
MATRARSYRRYRQILTLYPVVLLVYVGIAWSDWWVPGRAFDEVFPFFSWDLFSLPRQDGRLYTVRVTRVTGDHQPAAALLGRTLADPRAEPFLRDPRFQKTARSLARAYWAKRDEEIERLAALLGNFMRPRGVAEYDLIYLSFHPLHYYRGEETAQENLVASFRVAAPP